MDGSTDVINIAALHALLHCRKQREDDAGRTLSDEIAAHELAQKAQDLAREMLENAKTTRVRAEKQFYQTLSLTGAVTPHALERGRGALASFSEVVAEAERRQAAATAFLNKTEAAVANARERFREFQRATRKLSEAKAMLRTARNTRVQLMEELAQEEENECKATSRQSGLRVQLL